MTFLAITTTADRSRVVVSADEYVALPPEPARFEAIARTYEESYKDAYVVPGTGGGKPTARMVSETVGHIYALLAFSVAAGDRAKVCAK